MQVIMRIQNRKSIMQILIPNGPYGITFNVHYDQ